MSNDIEHRKLAAIMFTDMVGYSALAQRNEKLALELLEEHRRLLRGFFPRFGGREVETTGDGFLVEFASALEAARCAIEIQRALATRNLSVTPERQLRVRIGIHVGDVVHKDGHVLGDGVNIAARLQPLAEPGGICISVDVERQIRNTIEASLVKLGATELKNIKAPMELFRIVLPWDKEPSSSVERKAAERQPKAVRSLVWAAVAFLILAGVSWWLIFQFGKGPKQVANPQINIRTPTTRSADDKSIAVLPFVNMSADKADEYLSDGISEEIITALMKIKGLKVPARTSCFAFKGKNEDIQKIGEQLRVNTILEGSISKAGNQLRVTAQLISIADGFQLWSETYDRTLDDLLAIRTEVASRVAEALKGQLLGAEKQQLTKRGTENAEAHRLYLQGRYLWSRRTGESIKKAIELFDDAISKDPKYALAYSALADCYIVLPKYAGLARRDTMPKARAAALKALELDTSLVEPRATLAVIKALERNWPGAEAEFQSAIGLSPNYATAHHWLATSVLLPLGRHVEAVAEMKRAQDIDPLSPIINVDLGENLFLGGQEDLAIEFLQKQIALNLYFPKVHEILGRFYLKIGKPKEAIEQLETMRRLQASGAYGLDSLGFAYARTGRTNDAQKILHQMLELQRQGTDCRVGIALVQHALSDDEPALKSLEKAVEEDAAGLQYLNVDPLWQDLRPHSRFQAILKKMNLVK